MVPETEYDDAGEFILALRPTRPRSVIYRGQADADWHLTPSAFREGAEFSTEHGMETVEQVAQRNSSSNPPDHDQLRLQLEVETLTRFFQSADEAGLPLPEDSQEIRWHLENYAIQNWPWRQIRSILALAQHHGLPTRLLDWTWDWRVAAFIAARDVFARPSMPERLAMWSLDAVLGRHREQSEGLGLPVLLAGVRYTVQLVTAPSATNTNLHAQKGLFSLLVLNEGSVVSLDKAIDELIGEGDWPSPPLRKLTLPTGEAAQLLKLLACEGITSAAVFPDFGGVVCSLKEVGLWNPSTG